MIIGGFEVYVTCGGTRLQEATEEQGKLNAMVCNIEDLAGKDFSVCVNDLHPHKGRSKGFTVTVFTEGRKVAWDASERRDDFGTLTLDRGLDEERKERQLRFTVPRVAHGSEDDESQDSLDELGLLRVLLHFAKFRSRDSKRKPDPLSVDKRPIVKEAHDLSVRAHRQGFSTVALGAIIDPQSDDFRAHYNKQEDKWEWTYFTTGKLIGTFDFRHESQRIAGSEHSFAYELDFRAGEHPTHLEDEEWLDHDMRPDSDHSHSGSVPFGGSPRRSPSPLEDVPDPYAMDVDERELFAPAQTSTPRIPSSPSSIPPDEGNVDDRPERQEDSGDSDIEVEVDERDLFAPAQASTPKTPLSPSSVLLDESDLFAPAQASTPRTPSSLPLDEGNGDGRPEREEDAGDSDIEVVVDERDLFAPAQALTPRTPSSLPFDERHVDARPERQEDTGGSDIEIDVDERDLFAPAQAPTPKTPSSPPSLPHLDEGDVDVGVEPNNVPVPDLDAPEELSGSMKLKKLHARKAFFKEDKAYKKSRRELERVNLEIVELEVAEEVRKRRARR